MTKIVYNSFFLLKIKAIREIPQPQLAEYNLTMQLERLERGTSERANVHTRRGAVASPGHAGSSPRDEQRAGERVHMLHMLV